jgi:riboflavin biosynthesis pyrimidine reductase
MKPHVILHMASSIDGRILSSNWPESAANALDDTYERIHRELKGDAWIVGRVTMAEFGKGEPVLATAPEPLPRQTWRAPGSEHGPFAVAVDRSGKLHLNIRRANDDPIVVVLTEAVSDDHLAELHRDGISYIFAGRDDVDLAQALEVLNAEFGIERLLLEGGGGINGSFLAAGLVDEISLLICPVADGIAGPSVFDRKEGLPAAALVLQGMDRLDGDVIHLRYMVQHR